MVVVQWANDEEISQLQTRVDELVTQQRESISEKEDLLSRIASLMTQLQGVSDESSAERDRLLGQIRYLEIRVRELEEENARLRGEVGRVARECSESQEQLSALAGKLQNTEQERQQSREQINLLSSQLDQVQATAREPSRRLTKLWFAQESISPSDSGGRNEFLKAHREIVELWARHFNALLVYCQENDHANVPVDHVQHSDGDASTGSSGVSLQLGHWLREQRRMKRGQGKGRLLPERAAKLQRLVDQGKHVLHQFFINFFNRMPF